MVNQKRRLSGDERYLAEELYKGNLKFALKLALGGAGAALIGVFFLLDGLLLNLLEPIIGGMWWKGVLLIVAGIAAVVMGVRLWRQALRQREADDLE